jgi:hypothetical protein
VSAPEAEMEQVGWVRYDGDEYHAFIYMRPEEREGHPSGSRDSTIREGFIPVWVEKQQP